MVNAVRPSASWRASQSTAPLTTVPVEPDLGERYLDTIYQRTWVQDLYGEDALRLDMKAEPEPAVPGPRSSAYRSLVPSDLR